ncbi:M23 family metallopeptidase [Candidatus Liberibacter sp.]|uniref:M23 family metallopeptidase n=1 Tax=Candidatus Liberibacter sp. TaxID=34022 RepID=UPI0038F786C9
MSTGNGKIISAGHLGKYVNAIIIDHGEGISTYYGHLSRILVRKEETVKFKQVIRISWLNWTFNRNSFTLCDTP